MTIILAWEKKLSIPFYIHNLDSSYAEQVAKVLDTPFLTSGSVCKDVEAQINAFFGTSHCKMVNSWTNGTIATLLAMDIGQGDEVIIPAMTFIATANVVEILGAKPIFVDVCEDTLLIDLEKVKAAITPRTKAIIPVHLYGQMLDVKALREIVGKDIKIIEDCAHCFEGKLGEDRPGKYSDAAAFSFYATKNIACGEGGAVITNDEALYDRLCQAVLHGMSASAADRFKAGGYRHWDMVHLGTKANLPDLLAALLPPQIKAVEDTLQKREILAKRYQDAFEDTPIRMQFIKAEAQSAHHLFPIHVSIDKRDDIIKILNDNGINITVNYGAVPYYTYYKDKYKFSEHDFPIARNWGLGTISLPLYPKLSIEDQDKIIETITSKILPLIK
jgi:UDP-4-amino-4-deoxy-L-arabinose-oxoglutarate aminotransferase